MSPGKLYSITWLYLLWMISRILRLKNALSLKANKQKPPIQNRVDKLKLLINFMGNEGMQLTLSF